MKRHFHILLTKRKNRANYEKETGHVFVPCVVPDSSDWLCGRDRETGKDKGFGIYGAEGGGASGGTAE